MGVDRPLIRPSTPFGQTSIHRSRKPAPCRALCLPSLFVSFASYLPPPTLPLFSTCPCSCSLSSRSSPPAPLPLPSHHRHLPPRGYLQPRADTSNAPPLSHRLSDTHARYRWMDTDTYYTSVDRTGVRAPSSTNVSLSRSTRTRVYTILRKRKGRNSIDTAVVPQPYRASLFSFRHFQPRDRSRITNGRFHDQIVAPRFVRLGKRG